MVKSLTDFQTLNRHKIKTTTISNVKTCCQTKVWVLNLNLASKFSYDRILKIAKTRLLIKVVYWCKWELFSGSPSSCTEHGT